MTIAAVEPSLSPSMDIQVSSNFERLLFELKGRDGAAVAAAMRRVPPRPARCRPTTRPGARRASSFAAAPGRRCGDAARRSPRPTARPAMLIDPHTAVAVAAARGAAGRDAGDVADGGAGDARIRRNSPTRSSGRPASARRCRRGSPSSWTAASGSTVLPNDHRRGRSASFARMRGAARAQEARHDRRGSPPCRTGCGSSPTAIDTVETVSLGVWVDVGTRHEPAADQRRRASPRAHGVQGHRAALGARASPRRSRRSAATSTPIPRASSTAYYAKVLKEDVALGARHPRRHPAALDLRRRPSWSASARSILQEIGQANDTPDDIIFDHFQERAFPDQAMGRPVLGSAEIIKQLGARRPVAAYLQRPLRRRAHGAVGGRQCRARRSSSRSPTSCLSRHAGRARGHDRAGALCRRRPPRGARPRAAASGAGLSRPAARRPRLLRRLGAVDRVRRRHVLAPVPGDAREARPRLRDPLLRPRPIATAACSASMPAPARTRRPS